MHWPRYTSPADAVQILLGAIGGHVHAYTNPSFHFIACKHGDQWKLVKGRLVAGLVPAELDETSVATKTLLAGQFNLARLGISLSEFLLRASEGKIDTPFGPLSIDRASANPGGLVDLNFADPGDQQARTRLLQFVGEDQRTDFVRPEIDWELRAGSPPFHDLQDVAGHLSLGPLPARGSLFEAYIYPPIWVDYHSPVEGTIARPTVRLNKHLDMRDVTISVRILTGDKITRRTILGTDLAWEVDDRSPSHLIKGNIEVSIPLEAVVGCYAAYSGEALHFGWMQDPLHVANPSRVVLEVFDPALGITNGLLTDDQNKKGWQSTDLEDGVASALWAMGFAVTQVGRNRLLKDAVDVVARTPSGNYVLVECTSGILKEEHKVANLAKRVSSVRTALTKSWHGAARVVGMLVTSLPKDQVALEIRDVELSGIKVYTHEDLSSVVDQRTRVPQNADQLFNEMVEYLESLHPPST